MCFCAEASFTVGSILGIIGTTMFVKVKRWSLRLIALIPFIFAIQQFIEGTIWLYAKGVFPQTAFSQSLPYAYLFVAWVIWPIYSPLVMLIPETVSWRRVVCWFCLLMGLYISIFDLRYLLTSEVSVNVVGSSLDYGKTVLSDRLQYAIAVFPPLFISSIRKMWVFALLALVSFIISHLVYDIVFTSVWCFFSAAMSFVLFEVLYTANAESEATGS